ncbi:YecA family protein, partial [Pantoea anthophila]
ESRESRYYLSKSFKEKLASTVPTLRTSRVVESIDEPGKIYIFLFFPNVGFESYNHYRTERVSLMQIYMQVAFIKYKHARKVIIIATEPKGSSGRSEDLIFSPVKESIPKEERKNLIKISREHKILTHTLPNTAPSQPKAIIPRKESAKVGRNDPCPCGSGLKYKKCHM